MRALSTLRPLYALRIRRSAAFARPPEVAIPPQIDQPPPRAVRGPRCRPPRRAGPDERGGPARCRGTGCRRHTTRSARCPRSVCTQLDRPAMAGSRAKPLARPRRAEVAPLRPASKPARRNRSTGPSSSRRPDAARGWRAAASGAHLRRRSEPLLEPAVERPSNSRCAASRSAPRTADRRRPPPDVRAAGRHRSRGWC